MKYLPLRDFEDVTSALNFDTADCHVIGGCDLYTTKAAGSDKKLYKTIEHSLESQYESVLRLSASLSPPQAESLAASMNLSRSSPFGPLSQISSRRTFAYLIATLNASHPDYDFSHILRPTDFRKERSLRSVINTIDTTLYNLRPRPSTALLAVPHQWNSGAVAPGAQTPCGSQTWGPRMWQLINNEMDLRECGIYCYAPEDDPFDGEEGAIWSLNYFFFNKYKKRVCYLYLRGLSAISHSPIRAAAAVANREVSLLSELREGMGAQKRARFWLGDRADKEDFEGGWGGEDDEMLIENPGDDEVDADSVISVRDGSIDRYSSDGNSDIEMFREREKSIVRAMSEHLAESMEV
ncbi:mitogen-activated protein kinase MAF1 [Lepidopterella palustris CBS 459.81]|uniref:Repressor of RNA polymerase III transcription MAF1 n=1 Tax=Lepidopterella palustris CBS 459.81 TaxID=1314670 RepID=A0A8E2JHA7_9PEZI|nr:mitogen-activated protein kinase MAF1 [Lepidopterella palustris CBS 459.81]